MADVTMLNRTLEIMPVPLAQTTIRLSMAATGSSKDFITCNKKDWFSEEYIQRVDNSYKCL
ncbi:hypothetical protein FRC07_007549, partial [Ceratobasidium sp. 392]